MREEEKKLGKLSEYYTNKMAKQNDAVMGKQSV